MLKSLEFDVFNSTDYGFLLSVGTDNLSRWKPYTKWSLLK